MPDGSEQTVIRIFSRIADIAADQWNACAANGGPFVSHAFLSALEQSGSASQDTGWLPQHMTVQGGDGSIIAVAPLYLKNNSYGEYVFDWGWADAYERAGGQYYPKLQSAVPFTPVTGGRLMARPDLAQSFQAELIGTLAMGMRELAERHDLSSVHVTFPSQGECRQLEKFGFLPRIGEQFHWLNNDYQTFDDFLGDLTSRKRKAIRRERKAVADKGIELRILTGDMITEDHWDIFYQFYSNTSDRKWGNAYLTRTFFSLLHQSMPDTIVLIMAYDDNVPVGGAFNLLGDDTLYGRYWGCTGDYKFLHFEACYYQAIEYAIGNRIKRVEAGAQGSHKIQRGYLPQATYSSHWIRDQRFRIAVDEFLTHERKATLDNIRQLNNASPFRKNGN